jgi:putative MATE family efflux protein
MPGTTMCSTLFSGPSRLMKMSDPDRALTLVTLLSGRTQIQHYRSFQPTNMSEPKLMSKAELDTSAVIPAMLKFALSIFFGDLLQRLNYSINSIWVSHYLGPVSFTATIDTGIVSFFLLSLIIGIDIAASILMGQSFGAGNPDRARKVGLNCLTLVLGTALVIGVAGFIFTPNILHLMGTPKEAVADAIPYMRVAFVTLPLAYLFSFLTAAIRASGDAALALKLLSIMVVLDVTLNPLLIFGFGPIPAFHVVGSGLATLFSYLIMLGIYVWWFRNDENFRVPGFAEIYRAFDIDIVKELLRLGSILGLQTVVISTSSFGIVYLINKLGADVVAAYGVVSMIWAYAQLPAMSIGSAAATMSARCVGARNWKRVKRIALAGVLLTVGITTVLVSIIVYFDDTILGFLLPGGARSMFAAQSMNNIVIWSIIAIGISYVLYGVVSSTGAATGPLIGLFISLWVVRMSFASFFIESKGTDAISWAFFLAFIVSGLYAISYYRYGSWRRMLTDAA